MKEEISGARCSICDRLIGESSDLPVVIIMEAVRNTICLPCIEFLNSLRIDNGKRPIPVRPAMYVIRDWTELNDAVHELESANHRRDG